MTYNVHSTSEHSPIFLPSNLMKKMNLTSGGTLSLDYVDGSPVLRPHYSFADRVACAESILQPVLYNRKVRFIVDGLDTICISREGEYPKVGVAHCKTTDRMSGSIGKAIAYLRANGKAVPPILYG